MFSNNNNSNSGTNKSKRRSFFLWGSSSGGLGNFGSQTPTMTGTSTNDGPNNTTGGGKRTNSNNSKPSPMKSTLDKKPMNNRNPFIPSDKPSPTSRNRLTPEQSGILKTPSASEKRKVSSPRDNNIPTGIKNKNSLSHLNSHGNNKSSSTSSSHKHTSSSHTISSDRTKNSSNGHTSSQTYQHTLMSPSQKQKSSISSTSSSSPKKEERRQVSVASSHSSQKDEQNANLSSSGKPSKARRPPPPVDLSVLRNSMKKTPADKSMENKRNGFLLDPDFQEESIVALNYMERELPPSTSSEEKDQINRQSQQGKQEQTQEGPQETNEGDNFKQHRRQRSEAEKFEEELDVFIKEHSAIQDSPQSQQEGFYEEGITHNISARDVDGNDFISLESPTKDIITGSPLPYVDPLKLPEESQITKIPSTSQHSDLQNAVSSPPQLASPSVLDPLPTARLGPLLEPPPLPPKEPLDPQEPLSAIYTSPLPAATAGGRVHELTEAEKRKSAMSANGDEHADRFSFTNSLNDTSVKSIQQVALDDTRGAAPIVSNLSYQNSMDFAPPETNTDVTGNNPRRISHTPANSLNRPPLMNDHYQNHDQNFQHDMDNQNKSKASKNPFVDTTAFGGTEAMVQPEIIDSREGSSNEVLNQQPTVDPTNADELPLPRRKFRVVNEDRPTFYMNSFDESLSKENDEYDDTATHFSAHSNDSSYNNRFSIAASEKSNNFVPMNFRNPSLESQSPSLGIRSGFVSLDSSSENEVPKSLGSSSKTKESSILAPPHSLSNHHSMRSNISNNSSTTVSSGSPRPDKSVRLVSSYVEELRLKYFRTSNFLQAPPNLPVTLKQKNNLVQPKNVKVKIRTNSKQIGIKHGRAKQKLLALETTDEDVNEDGTMKPSSNKNKINVDHTREFHNLLNNKTSPGKRISQGNNFSRSQGDEELEEFMNDIPGDDAYDSDDAMAPLRERREPNDAGVTRSSTVKSYFTKQQEKLHQIDESSQYEKLPSNINIEDYLDKSPVSKTRSTQSGDSALNEPFSYGQGLHVANPDSASD